MNRHFTMVLPLWCALVAALAGCHGQHVTRIEVAPITVLLTASGQTHAFTARAFDQYDHPMKANFTWYSSNDAAVSVSANGEARSLVDLGSAQIMASASGVESPGALVVIAQLAPGAVLVSDAQVLSGPDPLDLDHAIELGAQSRLTLTGVSGLAPGTILLASEEKPVGGRVVSVTDAGGGKLEVILESVTLPELLAHYSIDGRYSIHQEFSSPVVSAPASPTTAGRSTLAIPDAIEGEREWKWGNNLACKVRGTLSIADGAFGYTMRADLDPEIHWNESVTVVKVIGTVSGTMKGTLRISAGRATGTLTCRLKLLPRTALPIGGPLAAVINLGVTPGLRVDGSLSFRTPGVEVGFEEKTTLRVTEGFSCDMKTDTCDDLSDVTSTSDIKPILHVEDLASSDFQVEGFFGPSAYVQLDASVPLTDAVGWTRPVSIVEGFFGGRYDFTAAGKWDQAKDPNYASKYALKLYGELGLGSDAARALRKLIPGISLQLKGLVFDHPLATSPFGSSTADKTKVKIGEPVKLTINLDPSSTSIPLIDYYNVEEIRIYRKSKYKLKMDESPIGTVAASNGQSEFNWTWTPTAADAGSNTLYAFVVTKLPFVVPLEINANSGVPVEVVGDGFVRVNVTGSRSQDFTYAQGSGSESTILDITYDLQLVGQPVFMGGPGVYLNSDKYQGLYKLEPHGFGRVTHDGQKFAKYGCTCYPGSTATVDNKYNAAADVSVTIGRTPYLAASLSIPVYTTVGTLKFPLPAIELNGTAQGSFSQTGCPWPDEIKQINTMIALSTIDLPSAGLKLTVADPSKPQRLTGTLVVPNMAVSVDYQDSQSAWPATWKVPLTVTVEYDLPYDVFKIPTKPAKGGTWLGELIASTLSSGAAGPEQPGPAPAVPAGPIYFGRRPTVTGRSVPIEGSFFASGIVAEPAMLCSTRPATQ
jgi:hypothetical protein